MTATIDRGNAPSTAFASPGGNHCSCWSVPGSGWQEAWLVRPSRRVPSPGRHRLGLKFRLTWRVRTYQAMTRTADGLIARASRDSRVHDCAAVPRQHSSALLHAVAMDGGSTSTESLYMGAFLTDLR